MRKKGFTLVEMLVVLGIIALLSAILLPIFKGLRESVYKHQCMSNMMKIYHALRMYYLDTGTYPEHLSELHSEELAALIEMGVKGMPVDPDTAKSILSRKGLYLSASDLHCPENIHIIGKFWPNQLGYNIDDSEPLFELGGQYYINPFYFNYDASFPVNYKTDSPPDNYDPLLWPWAASVPDVWRQIDPRSYARIRLVEPDDPDADPSVRENFNKQLYAKEPLSSTVITWCWAHRDLNPDGTPRFGSKDIVLFLDGHTEVRETSELLSTANPSKPKSGPWLLEPRRK